MDDGPSKAIVLAAGEGNRLAPLTNTRPKPMLPVANRPLLEWVIEALATAGIPDILLVVGYRQERIRNHFGDGDDWDVQISYVEQAQQLGTGHAILQAASGLDAPFLVLNGDRIIDPSIIERMRATAESPAMAVTQVSHPSTLGVVTMENDQLVEIEEQPVDPAPTAQINAGVYHFDPSIVEAIQETPTQAGELPITETLNRLEEPVGIVRYDGTWLDMTFLWDVLAVNAGQMSALDYDADTLSVPNAAIAPDVAMASGVEIGYNATICGSTALGTHVRIGPNTVLEQVVALPDATIGAGCVLQDAIIGANASIGANVTIPGGPADVIVEETVHSGVTLGAVIGDNTRIEGGTTIAPGTVIGNDVVIESGAHVHGRIPSGTQVQRG